MSKKWLTGYLNLVKLLEYAIVVFIFIGLALFAGGIIRALPEMNWASQETFYEFINQVLLLVIGLELIRMLVVHDLAAVLELLSFVIARKMLKPDIVSVDLLLAVIAFFLLLVSRKYLLTEAKPTDRITATQKNNRSNPLRTKNQNLQ